MDATKKEIMGLLILAVGVIGAWLYAKFKKKVGVVEYDFGHGVVRYQFKAGESEVGIKVEEGTIKLYNEELGVHIYLEATPDYKAFIGSVIYYKVPKGFTAYAKFISCDMTKEQFEKSEISR